MKLVEVAGLFVWKAAHETLFPILLVSWLKTDFNKADFRFVIPAVFVNMDSDVTSEQFVYSKFE